LVGADKKGSQLRVYGCASEDTRDEMALGRCLGGERKKTPGKGFQKEAEK